MLFLRPSRLEVTLPSGFRDGESDVTGEKSPAHGLASASTSMAAVAASPYPSIAQSPPSWPPLVDDEAGERECARRSGRTSPAGAEGVPAAGRRGKGADAAVRRRAGPEARGTKLGQLLSRICC